MPPTRLATRIAFGAAAMSLAACTDPLAVRPPARVLAAAPIADVAPLDVFTPGSTYFGTSQYVEYIAGDLPVIFSAPHGGVLEPAGIPVRTVGPCGPEVTTVTDANTEDLVRQIRTAFFSRTGHYPHIVINPLDRSRLDANRDIVEGACGNPAAAQAWREYHAFLDAARARVLADHGRGWYTDVHGHGHAIARLELGYELSATTLRRADAELDATLSFQTGSSIRTFSQQSGLSFSAALRGPTSLGTLLASAGYPSVPASRTRRPTSGSRTSTAATAPTGTPARMVDRSAASRSRRTTRACAARRRTGRTLRPPSPPCTRSTWRSSGSRSRRDAWGRPHWTTPRSSTT